PDHASDFLKDHVHAVVDLEGEIDVLVHCRSVHNRSGMICARTLIALGKDPEEAIELVRAKRGDGHALENERFVEWLRKEETAT
ncbi:MAG: protein-tyrosine phosphatase family protein, partial [Actinomycetota bacterium]